MKATDYIASFDSSAAMLRALARFLHGKDFPGLGITPSFLEPVGLGINKLPRRAREFIYIWSGRSEGIPPQKLGEVRAEEIARWVVSEYPRRRYPAAMIGSSSGALVHLGAALGIPWLPQTFLIPVRRSGVHPDEAGQDMEWGREPARALLAANPELQLHHMHDATQDRLMIQRMTYFRVKRLRLGETYERFLEETLPPGATIFLIECGRTWPTTLVEERHVFQHGAVGGATAEEFMHGGERVADLLRRYRSHRRLWDMPPPDGERPEAEWGFAAELRGDVERLARQRGYRIRRVVFEEPDHLSPLVADLYRWWYARRRLPANRLLVESFIVMEPWWALRTASVPFWMTFNVEQDANWVERYLDVAAPYDDIHMMLFSHGVDSIGLASIDRGRSILDRARRRGGFVGVDERAYPRDFAVFVRYYTDLKRKIRARYPLPGPLTLGELDAFLEGAGDRYPVQWIGHPLQVTRTSDGRSGTSSRRYEPQVGSGLGCIVGGGEDRHTR